MAFCINCGQQLPNGARFCFSCGKEVNEQKNYSKEHRRVIYEGELHKCPSCGEILESYLKCCPTCGFEMRGTKTSDSVQEFATRIENAESVVQKVDIIRSFPIPNDRENIFEFLILAATNIDVEISESDTNESKSVFNAWLSKMEQSYQKAQMLFGGDADLTRIQKIYNDTYKKIEMQRKKRRLFRALRILLRTSIMWCGVILFLIAFYLDASNSGANTSLYHFGGMFVLCVGAFFIGVGDAGFSDIGIGVLCSVGSMIMGTILHERFHENGSVMELGGGAALVIVAIMFVNVLAKKKNSKGGREDGDIE